MLFKGLYIEEVAVQKMPFISAPEMAFDVFYIGKVYMSFFACQHDKPLARNGLQRKNLLS